jgi:hypothetical protein
MEDRVMKGTKNNRHSDGMYIKERDRRGLLGGCGRESAMWVQDGVRADLVRKRREERKQSEARCRGERDITCYGITEETQLNNRNSH